MDNHITADYVSAAVIPDITSLRMGMFVPRSIDPPAEWLADCFSNSNLLLLFSHWGATSASQGFIFIYAVPSLFFFAYYSRAFQFNVFHGTLKTFIANVEEITK